MEEVLGWILGIGLLIFLAVKALGYVLAAIYWVVATLAYLLLALFDGVFSAGLRPNMPAVMWVIWGGVIGGILGFWTMAPVYGMKNWRPVLVVLIFVLILGTAVFQFTGR